jgi:hypothetical protein
MTHAIADELRRIYLEEPKIVRPGLRVLSSTLLTPMLAVEKRVKFKMLSVVQAGAEQAH